MDEKDVIIAQLTERLQTLTERIAYLEVENTQLQAEIARLKKNSSNSSKPPSSDIVKPPKGTASNAKRRKKRKIGGQPGHAKHEREPFGPEQINDTRHYELSCCPDCGGAVTRRRHRTRIVQQVELNPNPVEVVEHRAEGCWCRRCQKVVYAPLPASVERGGLLGPELTALVGYRKHMKDFSIEVQFCLAHFIREVKFILTLPGERERVYAERLLEALRKLFAIIHRREGMTEPSFARAMSRAREDIIHAATWVPPRCKQAKNLAKRLIAHGDAYFRFITTPGLEPTNNLAEQAIRFCVIDRKITQGTRGERGRRWCERIWTIIATCTQQGRSVFQYLRDAVRAHFNNQPIPTLCPAGP